MLADNDYTQPDYHSVMSIQLCELVDDGVFDWSKEILDWSEQAYSEEQYSRVCDMFIKRFWWREVSIFPVGEWMQRLHYRIAYELMPKYKMLYALYDEGSINPLVDEDEYKKERDIESGYPETQLTGNADYLKSGRDSEYERIVTGSVLDKLEQFDRYRDIDTRLLDELEPFFSSLYTVNVNSL